MAICHGHLRTTADVDLIVKLDPANALRAVRALKSLGYRPRAPVPFEQFADEQAREGWIRDKGLTVFSVWSPQDPVAEIDLFVSEPLDFDAVYSRAVRVALDTTTICVIGLEDLIELKERSGRPRDLEDVAALRALAAESDENEED